MTRFRVYIIRVIVIVVLVVTTTTFLSSKDHECTKDSDCTIRCIRAPCYQPTCMNNQCIRIKEEGYNRIVQENGYKRLMYTQRAIQDVLWRPKDVVLISHRGCIGRFPENTLAAIAACSEEGAHVAEVDVDMTSDGHIVLMHDDTIERTTNHKQWMDTTKVSDYTLEELQTNHWIVQNEYTGVSTNFRIPTFYDALRVAKFCGIHLLVDTKGRDYIIDGLSKDIHKADANNITLIRSGTIVSNTTNQVRYVVFIYDTTNQTKVNELKQYAANGIWYPSGDLKSKSLEMCNLRQDTNIASMASLIWDSAEYYLRDPDKFQQYIEKQHGNNIAGHIKATTHKPCPTTSNMEDPCLGAHIYQTISSLTCARLMSTDIPSTARAALEANGQMASNEIYPLESSIRQQHKPTTRRSIVVEEGSRGVGYHRMSNLPVCLEIWEKLQQQKGN